MRRPSLVYSPSSSRTSSRSSSPPSSSYFSSLTPFHSLPSSSQGQLRHKLPSPLQQVLRLPKVHLTLASAAHYLCLLLSLRLLLRTPRLITLVLTLTLVLSLEGRARAERLGLRNTMGGILGGVGMGLAGWTLRETALERHWQWDWSCRAKQGESDEDASLGAADYFSRRLCQGARVDLHSDAGGGLGISICALGAGRRGSAFGKPRTDNSDHREHRMRLSEAAAVYARGEVGLGEVGIYDAGESQEGGSRTASGRRPSAPQYHHVCDLAGQIWAADGGEAASIVVVIGDGGDDGVSIAMVCGK